MNHVLAGNNRLALMPGFFSTEEEPGAWAVTGAPKDQWLEGEVFLDLSQNLRGFHEI